MASPALSDLALVVVVDLEQAEGALDDLDGGGDPGGLEGDVGDPVDDHAGRGLDPQGGLPGEGQEAPARRAGEGSELWLEAVQEHIAPKRHRQSRTSPAGGQQTYRALRRGVNR